MTIEKRTMRSRFSALLLIAAVGAPSAGLNSAQANHEGGASTPPPTPPSAISGLSGGAYPSTPEALERYTQCMEELVEGVVVSFSRFRQEFPEDTYPRYPRGIADRICRHSPAQWRGLAGCVNRLGFSVYDTAGRWRQVMTGELYPTYPVEMALNVCLESGNERQSWTAQACLDRYAHGVVGDRFRQRVPGSGRLYSPEEAMLLCEHSGAMGPTGQCVAGQMRSGMGRSLALWACGSEISAEVRTCVQRFYLASFGMVSDEAVAQSCLVDPRMTPSDASRLARCLSPGRVGEHISGQIGPSILPGAAPNVPPPPTPSSTAAR